MKEIILAILGGGAAVELLNVVLHRTANSRQLNANALGSEVAALERTIVLLRENLEAEIQRHDRERQALTDRIDKLSEKIVTLNADIESLRKENAMLRGRSNQQLNGESDEKD
jgi:peptidoglycan hydrolase CwlO-like protein